MLARPSRLLLAALALAWAAGLLAILTHPVFVTNDSLSNYGHAWFVSREFWDGNGIPYHFPEIGHGDALAFPYAFVPWLSAALLRPLFGDWIVTLWLVLGALGVISTTWWAFPEVRRPLAFSVILANPMLVEGAILSQLPFLWAAAFFFAAIACWRRGHAVAAVLLMALAQGNHPAVLLPLAGLMVAGRLPWEQHRRRLVLWYALSVALALPGVAMVFLSPVVEDTNLQGLLTNFAGTVSLRAGVIFAPILVALALRFRPSLLLPLFVAVLALNVVLIPIRDTTFGWQAFVRDPDTGLVPWLESPAFEKDATYRILRSRDGKVGMYQIIERGGRLDSEFFPESIDRRSWPDTEEYRAFLQKREVDAVIIYRLYDVRHMTNEHALLDELVATGCARRIEENGDFQVYQVTACR